MKIAAAQLREIMKNSEAIYVAGDDAHYAWARVLRHRSRRRIRRLSSAARNGQEA